MIRGQGHEYKDSHISKPALWKERNTSRTELAK